MIEKSGSEVSKENNTEENGNEENQHEETTILDNEAEVEVKYAVEEFIVTKLETNRRARYFDVKILTLNNEFLRKK